MKHLKLLQNYLKTKISPRDIESKIISAGGSDRTFLRIKYSDHSFIILENNANTLAFSRYIRINQFLRGIGVGVAQIYIVDHEELTLLMEDLGDNFIMNYLLSASSSVKIKNTYQKILEELTKMQFLGMKHIDQCPIVKERIFSYHDFRWESGYFSEFFVQKYCGLDIRKREGLEAEFENLATGLDNEPRFFMHRDFQSQNLLLKENDIKIIDYQDARMGLLPYDLASLLRDPYYKITLQLQKELINYYINLANSEYEQNLIFEYFYPLFNLTALQRNMQALGAYAYLSMVKKKEWFKHFIPAGLEQLKISLIECGGFPALLDLVLQLKTVVISN